MQIKKFLGLLTFFIVSFSFAQNIEIKGKISDAIKNTSLYGANVTVKGTKSGVTTDFDGSYTIKVTPNSTLIFSSLGYSSKEVKVANSQTLNVSLSESSNMLGEIVINVGYGGQKKKNLTSAISTIKNDAFDDRPITDVGQALQGNAAGVQVVQQSGKPGAGININIRGLNSIESGVNPLFVIDGVQTYSTEGINPEDIAEMQILKDATATAIYGINGSSGVVLITTKRGKANKNSFNFSSYFGSSKIVKNIDVLNMADYKTLLKEISQAKLNQANSPLYAGIDTNWAKKVFQDGLDQNYDFSYTGGSDKIRTFASLGYQDTQGIVKPSQFSRINGRLNIDVDATSWLKAHANMNFIHISRDNISDNATGSYGGVILSALTTQPYLPEFADELVGRVLTNGIYSAPGQPTNTGGYQNGQFAANPNNSLQNPSARQSPQDHTSTYKYLGNLGFDVTLVKNLVWKPTSTVEISRSVNEYFIDAFRTVDGRNESDPTHAGFGRLKTTNFYTWNLENTLNYAIKHGNHDLTLLAGTGLIKTRFDENKISGNGFDVDLRKLDITKAAFINNQNTTFIERDKNSVSFFGRANYNFMGKYILNGVFRASGSSQLAPGHQWGYFPGISAAWIVSNENFLKDNSFINELKIRGGWGQTGNIGGIGEYASYATYVDYVGNTNTAAGNYVNTDLTWETTTDRNIGIDFGFIKNRVRLSVDAYARNTINLLQNIPIQGVNYLASKGEIENKGLELALNTINIKGDFNWNTNFNISFIKTNVVSLGYSPIIFKGFQSSNKIVKDQPLGNFFGYQVDRLDQTTGKLVYADLNGDGISSPSDRTVIGNALPKYTFGLTNTFSYKGFSLDALITSSQGNQIFNASRIDLEGMIDEKNQSTVVLDRWTPTHTNTQIPKAGEPTSLYVSSRFIEDGSYVRIKSVTLAYNFKTKTLGLNSIKLYATGQNLYTWTKYTGFDPEVSSTTGDDARKGLAPGIDYGTFPQVRTLIFGLKAGF